MILGECSIIGAGYLALFGIETPSGMARLASPGTIEEFARVLYSTFREADREGLMALVVDPPQGEGLGVAILERLQKAAQGR